MVTSTALACLCFYLDVWTVFLANTKPVILPSFGEKEPQIPDQFQWPSMQHAPQTLALCVFPTSLPPAPRRSHSAPIGVTGGSAVPTWQTTFQLGLLPMASFLQEGGTQAPGPSALGRAA